MSEPESNPENPAGADKPADSGGADKPADSGDADKPADSGDADKPADPAGADSPADPAGGDGKQLASRPGQQVRAANQVDRSQIAQFVTTIKNAEQQVGEHIIQALQHDDTVAVITTVAMGQDGQQRVISAALNPERMQQVQEILQAAEAEREEEEPCVGFHCLVKAKTT